MRKVDVITIDGPAGSGKSTVSRLLAARVAYTYLDTGAMYRAVAFAAKEKGIAFDDTRALKRLCDDIDLRFVADRDPPRLFMGNEDISDEIRTPEMDMLASSVSAVKEVRDAMNTLQKKIAHTVEKGLVAEGRDMGTVVFPDARCKVLLTASLEERASRRHREMLKRGKPVTKEEVLKNLKRRDDQDQNRRFAPLRPASDAFILDTTGMEIETVLDRLTAYIETH